jgi:hypothetical protein
MLITCCGKRREIAPRSLKSAIIPHGKRHIMIMTCKNFIQGH